MSVTGRCFALILCFPFCSKKVNRSTFSVLAHSVVVAPDWSITCIQTPRVFLLHTVTMTTGLIKFKRLYIYLITLKDIGCRWNLLFLNGKNHLFSYFSFQDQVRYLGPGVEGVMIQSLALDFMLRRAKRKFKSFFSSLRASSCLGHTLQERLKNFHIREVQFTKTIFKICYLQVVLLRHLLYLNYIFNTKSQYKEYPSRQSLLFFYARDEQSNFSRRGRKEKVPSALSGRV